MRLGGAGQLTVMDSKTGATIYDKELDFPGKGKGTMFTTDFALAGKYVYMTCSGLQDGMTIVIEAGPEYKEVVRNQLERFTATPIFSGKRMYCAPQRICIASVCRRAPRRTGNAGHPGEQKGATKGTKRNKNKGNKGKKGTGGILVCRSWSGRSGCKIQAWQER